MDAVSVLYHAVVLAADAVIDIVQMIWDCLFGVGVII